MRTAIVLVLVLSFAPLAARADARGQALFDRRCAHCHVVGQGAPVPDKHKSFVDITLAARDHDRKWVIAFLQKPYAVDPKSECHAALDARGARQVYRFLRARLRPQTAAKGTPGTVRTATGQVPPQRPAPIVPAPAPPQPQNMVRR